MANVDMETSDEASWDFYEMIQALMQAPSYHLLFEAALIIWIIRLLFMKSYKPEKSVLTQKEKDTLIAEWQPEPLVPDVNEDHPMLQNISNRIVDSQLGKYISLNGKKCLNMSTLNFLGMLGRKDIEEKAINSLRKYGVGACGPRGFYGTVDVHLEFEEKVAKFMKCEEAIVYAYGFATVASAIPAYAKRGDVIFCDEGVMFAIQKGILASRSQVRFFKHNDMDDLERLLQEQAIEDKKNPKKAKVTRRFLIVEGLYMNHGDLCPLPKLVELKWKYKVRIFMDESVSFGVLGKTGHGVTEHYGISIDEIDLICASLENALASLGGFCCGKSFVVDHQRLSGLGYCFSASQPPMMASAAIAALDIMEQQPEIFAELESKCHYLHSNVSRIPGITIKGNEISPIKHLQIANSSGDHDVDRAKLRDIVQKAEQSGLALTIAAYLEKEENFPPTPSIRLALNRELTEEEISKAVDILQTACAEVL